MQRTTNRLGTRVLPASRNVSRWGIGVALAVIAIAAVSTQADERAELGRKPNFVIIFVDDLGYQDLGCYGSPNIRTPNIDRMAKEGIRFTDFYAQTVCGPSRAALMTGCYPLRVAKRGNQVTIHPFLHPQEYTIAEVLRQAGYVSGCFGKWDLAGHSQVSYDPALLPTRQGFDYFFGTPTSNDSVVHLLRNEEVIERRADMSQLTRRYTDEAIDFITRNRERPFFVYLPHTMPHTRLAASSAFLGKSARGLYGDVVEELDWNVGRILDHIRGQGLDDTTYVVFLSDNGPWWKQKENGGSAQPLRGAKTSTWEGGLRVPCIVRAPGRTPAGQICRELTSTLDFLPTLAKLAGAEVPADRVIDGHDISSLWHGEPGAVSPTEAFFYYQHTHLQAVRSGKWKLHLPRPAEPPWGPRWASHIAPEDVIEIKHPLLFDLENDIGERNDVSADHPEIVARLLALAQWARNDIGDYDRAGKNARSFDPGPVRPDLEQRNTKPPARKQAAAPRTPAIHDTMMLDSPVTFPKRGALPSKHRPDVQVERYPVEQDYYLTSSPPRSLQQIERIQREMPQGKFTPPPQDWEHLPRTRKILAGGGELHIFGLGDSIVNDIFRSGWIAKLAAAYPKAKIRGTLYVRGGGGCAHYREENRIQKYLVPFQPDLVFIGGISQKQDYDAIRDVIQQIRRDLPQCEILLATGAFGSVDPRRPDLLARAPHSGTGDYGVKLKQIAAEENCAYLDMTTPWAEYIRSTELHPHTFYRDRVHANEAGEQILSKILLAFFRPAAATD